MRGDRGEALHAGGGADERGQPVAVDGRLLVALLDRQALHAGRDRLIDGGGVEQHRAAGGLHMHRVVGLALLALARGAAAAHLVQHAGRAAGAGRDRLGALAQGQRLVQRVAGVVGEPGAGERAEVGRAVVPDLAHDRQARERLVGELEPDDLLGEAGPAVVAGFGAADQAQLPDLGLQRGRADDVADPLGDADHLADARPGLAGGEVGAHAVAQVGALADVEDLAALVLEEVDAGGVRHRLGQVALALLLGSGGADERLELFERVHLEGAGPLDEAVQHVARWLWRPPARGGTDRWGCGRTGRAWTAWRWASRRGSAPGGRGRRCRRPGWPAGDSRARRRRP